MTFFDYAVLAIVAASVLLGLWRGVVSEILSLAAWVLAFFAAREWGAAAGAAAASGIADPAWRSVAGFVLVFVATLVLVALVRFLLSSLLHAVGLGFVDRGLGAAFGIVRGVLLVFLAVALGGMTALPREPWWREAKLAPPLETAVLVAKPWLPEAAAVRIRYR